MSKSIGLNLVPAEEVPAQTSAPMYAIFPPANINKGPMRTEPLMYRITLWLQPRHQSGDMFTEAHGLELRKLGGTTSLKLSTGLRIRPIK